MAQSSATYRVDLWKLEQLLAALKGEYENAKLSAFHRVCFVLLQIAVYTIPIALLALWLVADPALEGVASQELFIAAGCILIAVAILSLAILLPLNVPLVHMVIRQVRLDRKLRRLLPQERGALPPPSPNPRRERWLRALASGMLLLVATTVVLAVTRDFDLWRVTVALVVLGVPGYLILSRKRLPFRLVRIGFWLLVLALVAVAGLAVVSALGLFGSEDTLWLELMLLGVPALFVLVLPAFVLLSNRYLSWLRGRMRVLEDVDRLRSKLDSYQEEARETGELAVDLSSAEALQLERVEKTLIGHQRAVAIERADRSRDTAFTTFKTQAARAQIEGLGGRERVLAESVIEELSVDPRPGEARGETAGGPYRLPVAGTGIEVRYELDDELRQVRIWSVGPPGPDDRAESGSAPRKDHG